MPAKESRAAMAALLASGFIWGVIWLPLKFFAALGLNGHVIGLTAYALLAIVSLPFIWRERVQWQPELKWLLLIGLFFGIANMAFTLALMTGSVVRAMLLFYLLPAWGAIGGALFLKERIGPSRLIAVALSLSGVFVIMGGTQVLSQSLSLADLAALTAGLGYTAAGIINRKAQRIPLASRSLSSFVGCALIAVCALALTTPDIPALSATNWMLLILFSFVWLLGGTFVTTYGVTHVQASRAAILQVVELLVAVFSAVMLGGEILGLNEWAGAVLIIMATVVEAVSYSKA
jgi:drug/metabolite transporter (DMT)-like permease